MVLQSGVAHARSSANPACTLRVDCRGTDLPGYGFDFPCPDPAHGAGAAYGDGGHSPQRQGIAFRCIRRIERARPRHWLCVHLASAARKPEPETIRPVTGFLRVRRERGFRAAAIRVIERQSSQNVRLPPCPDPTSRFPRRQRHKRLPGGNPATSSWSRPGWRAHSCRSRPLRSRSGNCRARSACLTFWLAQYCRDHHFARRRHRLSFPAPGLSARAGWGCICSRQRDPFLRAILPGRSASRCSPLAMVFAIEFTTPGLGGLVRLPAAGRKAHCAAPDRQSRWASSASS